MATLARTKSTYSLKHMYRLFGGVLTFLTLALARPHIEEILETIPNPLPDNSNPHKVVSNEVMMNEYLTSREGVSLYEIFLGGKPIFTIEDTTNNFRRELTEAQFESVKKDLNAIADQKNIKDGALNLTTEQENIFESIGFESFDCTIQTDSGKKEEVTLYFEDERKVGDIWSIEVGKDSAPVEAQLESFDATLSMPLGQYPELRELNLDSCEG